MHVFLRFPPMAAVVIALAACSRLSGSTQPPASMTQSGFDGAVYEHALNGWLNRSEADLVSAWGVPERSQRLTDGGQALQYVRVDEIGRVMCSTLFTSDLYGMIRTWNYRGLDCHAPALGDYGAS
jgi:hypothetical protein